MALLSCFLVLRGWSLMGDAISHAVLPGIVVAYWFGAPLALGAFAAGMLCAGGDRVREGEQPGQGGHRHGHRLLRHVRARDRALRLDARPTCTSTTSSSATRWASAGPTSAGAPAIAAAGGRRRAVRAAGLPGARLRPAARARHRAAGAAAALRPARARLADRGGGAAGGRDHPRHRLPDRARAPSPSSGCAASGRCWRSRPRSRSPPRSSASTPASGSTPPRRRPSCSC